MKKLLFTLIAMTICGISYGQTQPATGLQKTNNNSAADIRSLQDAGVISILSPTAIAITGDIDTVTVRIKNFGTDTLHTIPVNYQTGSGNIVSTTFTGLLLPDSIATLFFLQLLLTNNQKYTIRAFYFIN